LFHEFNFSFSEQPKAISYIQPSSFVSFRWLQTLSASVIN